MVIGICIYVLLLIDFLIFTDAIIFRFGQEKYNKSITRVRKQANEKCCDMYTKKILKRKTVN